MDAGAPTKRAKSDDDTAITSRLENADDTEPPTDTAEIIRCWKETDLDATLGGRSDIDEAVAFG